jgi:DNA-binding response OmpR family regulator
VLLAEDDEALRELIASYLRSLGHTVVATGDGAELLQALAETLFDGEDSYDAIVSDVYMPAWSGVEVLNGLRCAGSRIPVVLMTACPDPEISLLSKELGAKLLIKPFDLSELSFS